jgi:hypothetical protein
MHLTIGVRLLGIHFNCICNDDAYMDDSSVADAFNSMSSTLLISRAKAMTSGTCTLRVQTRSQRRHGAQEQEAYKTQECLQGHVMIGQKLVPSVGLEQHKRRGNSTENVYGAQGDLELAVVPVHALGPFKWVRHFEEHLVELLLRCFARRNVHPARVR